MIALVAAFWLLTIYPQSLGPLLGFLSVIFVMVGALTPDLDQPTANLWRRLLAGRAIGRIFNKFSGGHRHLTHSLIGILIIGFGLRWLLTHLINPVYINESFIIWRAFMIGYISHPIADSFTDHGVPWFWPLSPHIKIPPGPGSVRVTTGSLVELLIVRGGIIIVLALLAQSYWPILLHLFQS